MLLGEKVGEEKTEKNPGWLEMKRVIKPFLGGFLLMIGGFAIFKAEPFFCWRC